MNKNINTIDEYINGQPLEIREILLNIRKIINESCPDATECISYAMPAYRYYGILVYFAAFKKHIGLYALPSGNEAFQKQLLQYKTGRGSIQFSLDKPIPYKLISKIVKFRVKENLSKKK
jgi:uncharacterized protein YdhG (YjbR/CyaY superfamily)